MKRSFNSTSAGASNFIGAQNSGSTGNPIIRIADQRGRGAFVWTPAFGSS
jgi:hypothetical protein